MIIHAEGADADHLLDMMVGDYREVRQAKWIYSQQDDYGAYTVTCSCCDSTYHGHELSFAHNPKRYDYCPGCGAEIRCVVDGEADS